MIFCTQAQQHKPAILVFRKLRQEHKKLKASLGHLVKSRTIFATKKSVSKDKAGAGKMAGDKQRCLLSKPNELSLIPSSREGGRRGWGFSQKCEKS